MKADEFKVGTKFKHGDDGIKQTVVAIHDTWVTSKYATVGCNSFTIDSMYAQYCILISQPEETSLFAKLKNELMDKKYPTDNIKN